MKNFPAVILLFALGCDGNQDATPDGRDDTDGATTACEPADQTMIFEVPAIPTGPGSSTPGSWTIDAVVSATTAIGHATGEAKAQRVAIIEPTGLTELATFADSADYGLAVAAVPGTRCAVIAARPGLGYACAGQPLEMSAIDVDAGDPLFVARSSPTLWMFSQTFASFTAIERTGPNVWHEHQQFVSSISYPTDATASADGRPIACYISPGDRAVVTYANAELATTQKARWCKLAVDGDTLHVVTDVGYGTLSLASITIDGVLAVTATAPFTTPPERLILRAGRPYAIVRTSNAIDLVPLAGGEPAHVALPAAESVGLDWDAASSALRVITADADFVGPGPNYPQTIRYQTHCLD